MSIQTERLDFSYGRTAILKDINLNLKSGQLICVLGENGAGKSTMFRCMLNILRYFGRIFVDGKDIKDYNNRQLAEKIAYLPQRYEVLQHYSVEQMVLLGTCSTISFWSNPGKKQFEMAKEAIRMIGIEHLKDDNFAELSGGEQQMVLIARAVAQQARIIIMDEPCSSLDYGNQIRMMELSKKLTESGYLILQSTHNPDHVLLYADEVVVLKRGEVLCQGQPGKELTEEILSELYGVSVSLPTVSGTKKRICMPANFNQ